jgi:hypothetical protein
MTSERPRQVSPVWQVFTIVLVLGCTAPKASGDRASLALAAGVGSEPQATPTAAPAVSAPVEYCHAACEQARICERAPAKECVDECLAAQGPWLDALRPDVIRQAAPCVRESDCSQSDADAIRRACVERVLADVGPSRAVFEFCSALDTLYEQCQDERADDEPARCLQVTRGFSDDAVEKVMPCTEGECAAISMCLFNAFGPVLIFDE